MPHRFGLPARRGRGRAHDEFSPFGDLHREVDRLFEEFARPMGFGGGLAGWRAPAMLAPQIDVAETPEDLTITAELPGIDEKDVELMLHDGALVIKGEKKAEKESKDKTYRVVERSYGAFERTVPVPFDVAEDAVEASFAKGVLTVRIAKPAEAKPSQRKIAIRGGT